MNKRQFPRIYNLLVRSGHGHFSAALIVLDARRGDHHARQWIKIMRGSR